MHIKYAEIHNKVVQDKCCSYLHTYSVSDPINLGTASARYTSDEYFRERPNESLRIGLSNVLPIPTLNMSVSESNNIDAITWEFG